MLAAFKILASDADYLIVLEDDMKLANDFKTTLDKVLEYLDTNKVFNWNLINIGPKKKKICNLIQSFQGHELLHAYYFLFVRLALFGRVKVLKSLWLKV